MNASTSRSPAPSDADTFFATRARAARPGALRALLDRPGGAPPRAADRLPRAKPAPRRAVKP